MKISALILAKNEEEMIGDCLAQLDFVREIIVLDCASTDKTLEIAKKYTRKVFTSNLDTFDKNRDILAAYATSSWLLYLDADERLSPEGIVEIKKAITQNEFAAYYFPRKNIILGKWLRHGGWWPDYVPRLFVKDKLIGWYGLVHESPKISGNFGYLKTPLVHLTARSLGQMFTKTIRWAKIEAELAYGASQPQVTILKVVKVLLAGFCRRFFIKKGFWDGQVGLIEAIYQALHQVVVLVYLWELQNNAEKQSAKTK